jgi:hypothetical protein
MNHTLGKLAVVATGALALIAFIAWMMRPQTRYAGDFSEASFTAIKRGDLEAEVLQHVGAPLSSFEEETLEEWCFSEQETWQPAIWTIRSPLRAVQGRREPLLNLCSPALGEEGVVHRLLRGAPVAPW